MNAIPLKNLGPAELAEAAVSRTEGDFLAFCGRDLLLLVRVQHVDAYFTAGVMGAAFRGSDAALKPAVRSMEFHTEYLSSPLEAAAIPPALSGEVEKLNTLLTGDAHLAVPLRKRSGADALHTDRVSLGRARNKDIVLRDQSVSKFHGWFEVDDAGGLYFSDAGSKNTTRVNGRPLVSGERTRLEPADTIRFGSIDGLICSPQGIWAALNAPRAPI